MHVLDQQLDIHRQMLWYTCTGSTVSYTDRCNVIHVLDPQLVIHRQMLWYTCTGSTVSYTYRCNGIHVPVYV
jgi:uncharacterized protein YhaN